MEIQMETMLRLYLTQVRMANINKTTDNICWRGCREREPSLTVGGLQTGPAILEIHMVNPEKAKNKSTTWSNGTILWHMAKEFNSYSTDIAYPYSLLLYSQ